MSSSVQNFIDIREKIDYPQKRAKLLPSAPRLAAATAMTYTPHIIDH